MDPKIREPFLINSSDIEEIKLCKNDEDRVKLALNSLDQSYCLTGQCSYGRKSSEESEKFRHFGNLLLMSPCPELEEILKLYSKSILYAPPGSEKLSLAYANRSAILFRGEYYEECLEDISRALEIGYPDSLKPKLLIRRTTCNYALTGNVDFEADESLIEARGLIEKLPATNKMRKMVEEILNHPEKITSVGRKVKKTRPKYRPEMKGRNPHLPGASDAIALKYSKESGRHLIATRDINSGEVLLIQKPYTTIVPDKWIYCICSHCAKGTWNGIPCDYCIHAMFCSAECKRAAWEEYHDVECTVLEITKMVEGRDYVSMGFRLTVKALKEAGSLGALKKRLKELDSVKASDIEFTIDPNTYETFYVMSDNPQHYEPKHLFVCSSIAGQLTYRLAVRTNFLGEREVGSLQVIKDSEKLLFVAGLMAKNMRIAQNRAYGLQVEDKELKKVDYVSMLIPVSSYLNHRCYDGVQQFRVDEEIVLVTSVPINKGDQVFAHYSLDYKQIPRDSRRKYLKDQWQFDCNCLACTEGWSDSTSTWDDQHLSPEMILDVADAMERVQRQSSEENKDPMRMIPLKEHICRLIDFTYPRVEKPSLVVEELVELIRSVNMELSSAVFPRFVTKS